MNIFYLKNTLNIFLLIQKKIIIFYLYHDNQQETQKTISIQINRKQKLILILYRV